MPRCGELDFLTKFCLSDSIKLFPKMMATQPPLIPCGVAMGKAIKYKGCIYSKCSSQCVVKSQKETQKSLLGFPDEKAQDNKV